MRTISITALRRLVIAAQGYVPRTRRADADDVEAAIRRAMCIQLDTVTAVERSHRIAISTRVGLYPRDTVPLLLRQGRIIENWTHALCLVPAEDWPLYAWARARMRDGVPWHGDVKARYPELAERVLDEIRERGPLGSRDFTGKADPAPHRAGTSSEAMWSWKPAKQMLDALFASGELVIAGRVNFQRRYDLPERVLPREVLNAPIPSRGGGDQGAGREGRPRPRRAARIRDRRARAADLGLPGRRQSRAPVRRLARRRREARADRRRGRR